MGRRILERDHELGVLATAAQEAAGGAGSVVLVFGEAGIGKSSVAEAVRAHLPAEGRILFGYCDDLATPGTLGPFRDLVGSVGTELSRALQAGDNREQVLSALRAELDWRARPTVLVVEDVHWADAATLDVLRYLVRRIAGLPAVLVLTYRDDELDRDHPLRQLLGQASGAERVHHLPLKRLSAQAVRHLSAGSPLDGEDVFSVTSGNPFFVSEVLASGGTGQVPYTIVDAVLARVRHLPEDAQDALEQLAVVPSALDRWLVDALVPGGLTALARAEERGLLVVSPVRVAFRHELTRRTIVDALPAARRVELHRRVLAELAGREGVALSRVVHHAAQAGDQDAIATYGPAAASDAADAGAHREAAAHYELVLAQEERFPPAELADLLQRYAIECYRIGSGPRAVEVQERAVALLRSLGDPRTLGAGLRWLSRMRWWNGDRKGAEDEAAEATEVLEAGGDPRLLALAYSNQSQLHMLAERSAESIDLGERAAALARTAGDSAVLSHALTNVGLSQFRRGDPGSEETLDEALRVALEAGESEHACRTYVGIIWGLLDQFRLDEADHRLTAAVDLAEESEHFGFLAYLFVSRGRLELARASWEEAVRAAEQGVGSQPPVACPALTVLGRVRVRRGLPGGDELLRRAWDLAVGINELQRTGPVAAARAEAAWLAGDLATVRAVAGPVHDEALRLDHRTLAAELGYWLVKAGESVPPNTSGTPYALQQAGRWREAAEAWGRAGCPYEHAAALAESPDEADQLAALGRLDRLGAEPLARIVRSRMRELGVARVPRRPLAATLANPLGLTQRQLQVLRMIGDGLTNAEIAGRLVVSARTVENHVAAVLKKLGARTRREAVTRAAELGIDLGPDR
ncbi:LuxR family transcriptional regulator [Actinomadura sp. DC4]|uniref:ATP-binding protein n=1 Tax=Actinomadura sp. DC4 TaxID=3055069 RepID=UPI0025B06537|nr:LuxR family transcriptional regulator [Actinomadura sp. DC4]MDN3358758.1 AAA family ATPase [Actinomadura sp. DC4]